MKVANLLQLYVNGVTKSSFCIVCIRRLFFCNFILIVIDRFNKNNEKQVETKDTSLLLNVSPNLALLLNQLKILGLQ